MELEWLQYRKPSKGGLSPSWLRGAGGLPPPPPKRVLFTLHHDCRKKNQFIEISICALEKINVQTLRCRATREILCANGSVPCTAAETITRTKRASFVWEFLKIQGLSLWNTDHARRVPTFKSMFQLKKIQTYLDLVWLFQNRYISVSAKKCSSSIWV